MPRVIDILTSKTSAYIVGCGAMVISSVTIPISTTVPIIFSGVSIFCGVMLYSGLKTKEVNDKNLSADSANQILTVDTSQERNFALENTYKNILYSINVPSTIALAVGTGFLVSYVNENDDASSAQSNDDALFYAGNALVAGSVILTGLTHVVVNSKLGRQRENLKAEETSLRQQHVANLAQMNRELEDQCGNYEMNIEELERQLDERSQEVISRDQRIEELEEQLRSHEKGGRNILDKAKN